MNPFNDPMMREAMRRARELWDNPAYRHWQEMHQRYGYLFDNVNKMMSSPEYQMIRDAQKHHREIQSLISSPAFTATRDFLLNNDAAFRIINSPEWREIQKIQRQRHDMLEIANLSTAKAISEVTQFLRNNSYFGFSSDSFSAQIFSVLSQIEEPTDEQSLQEFRTALENLLSLIVSKIEELKPNSINYWALFNFALSIFFFLYPLYEGQKTEQRITDSVNQTRAEIIKEIEKLKPANIEEIYYVIEREAKLRNQPRPKSVVIQILPPNQRVKLIQTKHEWIYVEYFDYIEGVPKNGWLLKKYAKRL